MAGLQTLLFQTPEPSLRKFANVCGPYKLARCSRYSWRSNYMSIEKDGPIAHKAPRGIVQAVLSTHAIAIVYLFPLLLLYLCKSQDSSFLASNCRKILLRRMRPLSLNSFSDLAVYGRHHHPRGDTSLACTLPCLESRMWLPCSDGQGSGMLLPQLGYIVLRAAVFSDALRYMTGQMWYVCICDSQ